MPAKDPSASSGDASWKRAKSVSPGTRCETPPVRRPNTSSGRTTTEEPRRKNHDLKQLVADLSLEVHRFKKRPSQLSTGLSAQERSNVISRVEETRW